MDDSLDLLVVRRLRFFLVVGFLAFVFEDAVLTLVVDVFGAGFFLLALLDAFFFMVS